MRPVVSSRSLGWVIPKPGKVGFESCRLVHGMCDFWKARHRGLFWRERGQNYRRIVMDSNEHVGGREQWLHTWHWQRAVDTRASHLLTKVWTWQTPSVRWTEKNTEDVIQPRLREIDRFFFITRERRLFTEVLAPDGFASALAQVGFVRG